MTWKPTNELRWKKFIYSYSWSTQWDANYTMSLQQKWVEEMSGEEEWRELPTIVEEKKDMICYG